MKSSPGERMRSRKKVDNHEASIDDKVELRRRVLEAVGGAVFDGFAGAGAMYSAVWKDAERYVGCDERPFAIDDKLDRELFCADVHRVMRNIDLQPFTIFDLDAYGSPWSAAIILAARRKVKKGERIGVVLTEGSGLKLKFGQLPGALAKLTTMKANAKLPGINRSAKEIAARAIVALARRMSCKVERTWRAERPGGAAMLYFGVVLVGV